jgi:hypothetical protein
MPVDVTTCIAGLARTFRFGGPFHETFVKKYGGFSQPAPADGVIEVCTLQGVASHLDENVEIRRHARGLTMQRNGFRALLDHNGEGGTLEILPELMVFDSFLRVLYSHILLHADGLLLHSSGVIRRGKGYVFTGVSGAGKTTISKLPGGNTFLSDGVVAVRGTHGSYSVHGTPFQGEIYEDGANASAPVSQVFFLNKAPENFTTPLTRLQAVQKLLRSTISYPSAQEDVALALARASRFLGSVRFSNLHFAPEPSVWEFIDSTETGTP